MADKINQRVTEFDLGHFDERGIRMVKKLRLLSK